MKKTVLGAILLAQFQFSFAQQEKTGIQGIVLDANKRPLIHTTIRLEPSNLVTKTDAKGQFYFSNMTAGTYQVQASSIGMDQAFQQVIVGDNEQKHIVFYLSDRSELLQLVEVTGRTEQQYTNRVSFGGTKTGTVIKDVPQSIQYVTKELMQDQAAVRTGDIIKNISGVNQYTFYDDVSIRGFRNQGGVGSNSSNQLFNGLRTVNGFWRQNLINYLERVEVIKGPASALFGNSNPGGTINKVTKKPLEEDRKSVSMQYGSYNTFRFNSDFTGPANKDKTLLYRLNLGYENANSFRDLLFDKNVVIAPSFSYIPSERTRINMDMVYNKSNSRLDRGQSIFGSSDLYSTPISMNVADVNDFLNEETYIVTASLSHKLTNQISFNASYLRTGYRQDLFEHRSTDFAVDKNGKKIEELALRRASMRHNEQFNDSFTAYLSGQFKTGQVNQQILVGYDFNSSVIPVGSSQSDASGYRLKDGTIASKYVVKDSSKYEFYNYKGKMIPKPNVSSFDLTKNEHGLQNTNNYIFAFNNTDVVVPYLAQQHSIYIQDQIDINKLKVLLGLRYESYIDQVNYATAQVNKVRQHRVLPRIGATYALTNQVNMYATYTTGYNPQSAKSQNAAAGGPFDPLTSYLLEAGVKTDWFNQRLSVTASVYQIEQRNGLYNALDPDRPDLLIQVGKDKAKGIEFDAMGQILPNLNIVATYAYNIATLSGAQGGADSLYNNQQKPNAPKHQGSVWLKYAVQAGPLDGLGLAFGGNYVGKRSFGFQGQKNILPTPAPDYMLLNAAVYYKVNKVLLQFNMMNLTNKTHWVGGYDSSRLYPGMPRNWMTTMTYIF